MRTRWRPWRALAELIAALGLGTAVCHADALTERVLQSFRAEAPQLHAIAKSDEEVLVTTSNGPLSVYLDNLRVACASDKNRCQEAVSSFVQGVASVQNLDQLGTFNAERIYAVLRARGFGERTNVAFKDQSKQVVVLPFMVGLEVLFVVDGERAVRFVNHADLVGAGLTEAALLERASQNAARLPELRYEPMKEVPDLYFMSADDGLGSSRVFDKVLWERLEAAVGGRVAVAVPTRDWVLFARADRPEAIAKLRTLVGRIIRGEPYAVSDTVMIRDNATGWKPL